MRHFEIFDKNKTYFYGTGTEAAPEKIAADYPKTQRVPCIIETDADHLLFGAYWSVNQLRADYGLDENLTDDEVLAAVAELANQPAPEPEPSPEERIAAIMEYNALANLPDDDE